MIMITIPISLSICCQGDSEEPTLCEIQCAYCFPFFTNWLKRHRENQTEYPNGYSRTDFLRKR